MRTHVSLALLSVLLLQGCAQPQQAAAPEPAQPAQQPPSPGTLTPQATEAARLLPKQANVLTATPLDGFPRGQKSAEGVACDLARSFITTDAPLFRAVCMPGDFIKGEEYQGFLDQLAATMEDVKAGRISNEGAPTAIKRVFKARNLSKNGPGSAGYALFSFNAVQFVDVECRLTDGSLYTNRTLVFQLADKTWRVMPRPDLVPMLSEGLNDEPDSTQEWVYERPWSPGVP